MKACSCELKWKGFATLSHVVQPHTNQPNHQLQTGVDIRIWGPEANSQKWAPGSYICSQYIKKAASKFSTCCTEILFTESKLIFSLSGNLLLRESPLHNVNCLSHLILNCSLSTQWSCWGALFGTFAHNLCFTPYWKTYELVQIFLNVALQWFISLLRKQCKTKWKTLIGGPHGISEKRRAQATASFTFTNVHPWLYSLVMSCLFHVLHLSLLG